MIWLISIAMHLDYCVINFVFYEEQILCDNFYHFCICNETFIHLRFLTKADWIVLNSLDIIYGYLQIN